MAFWRVFLHQVVKGGGQKLMEVVNGVNHFLIVNRVDL